MDAGAASGSAAANQRAQTEDVDHQSPNTSQVTSTLVCHLRGVSLSLTR